MKNDFNGVEGPALDNRQPNETSAPRGRRGARRRATQPLSMNGGSVRFFLSKAESNGTPLLADEFESEAEAMLESLKTGRTYFVISEWKSSADLSKKLPQIRKECVTAKKVN
jgi:hypothetical protein